MENKRRIALITGATSGIGRAVALELGHMGYDVIATGRRQTRLQELEKEFLQHFPSQRLLPCSLDVRDLSQVESVLGGLPADWKDIDVLINNAGLAAGLEPLHEGDINDWEQMIDTNVKGLLYVSKVITPGMVKRKSGHIFNVGSIAGREVYPGGNVYCATKHAVFALSKGMRMDLLPYGIKVTDIEPGAVHTEFSLVRFHQDSERAEHVYDGYQPLTGGDIARCIRSVLELPAHVCVNEMLITPVAQASSRDFFRQ